MSNLLYRLKHLPYYLSAPFFFCAFILICVNLIILFPAEGFDSLYIGVSRGISALFSFCAAAFVCYYVCKNTKKAIAAGLCVMLNDLVLFSLCGVHISFVFSILFSLLFAYFFKRYNLLSAFALCSLLSLVFALAAGLLYENLYSVMKDFCLLLKGRGELFGAVNNIYSLLFSDNLSELFYHTEYSGTAYIGGRVVSGVLDIFEAQGTAGIYSSKFLAGKYFVNIFISPALFALLYSRLERETRAAFSLCFAVALIFGDIRLFSLFILLYNPALYLGFLLLSSVSYLAASLLDIRMVFFKEGGIFELIKYRDKIGYFILTGLVIAVLSYFFESIILSKFDFQSRKILPSEVKKIIDALGGERNIQRVENNEVYLKNPNLINILKLDCDIKGNTAMLNFDDYVLLKKYY